MKKAYTLIAGLALVAALASCDRIAEFKSYPFVRLQDGTTSYSVNEDVGKLTIPVTSYDNENGSGSVTFEVVDPKGAKGTAFTVEPSSGVLNFTGNQTQNITVTVKNNEGVYTGNVAFQIKFTGVSGDLTMGAPNALNVTIVDKDIPVTWDYVEDIWEAQDYTLAGAKDGDPYHAQIKKVDDTHLKLINLWGGEEALDGTITFDAATNTAEILFDARQVVMDASSYGYGNLILLGQNDAGSWAFSPVKAKVTAEGITIGPWNMLITAGEYANYLWDNSGYNTVLTK